MTSSFQIQRIQPRDDRGGSHFGKLLSFGLLAVMVLASGCRNAQPIACSPGVFDQNHEWERTESGSVQVETPIETVVPASHESPVETYGDVSCASTSCGYNMQPISFRQDLHDFAGRLGDDAAGFVNWENAALTGVAAAGTIAIYQGWDDDVREYTEKHPKRWGQTSGVIGYFGHPEYHVPALLGLYGWSVMQQDPELHQCATTLISAYTLTSISVLSLKLIADTDRPSDEWNDGRFGFPSYHAASTFTLAAVTEEYHGLMAAAPLYTLAGLVSWSRIDERDHDLSDVVFGAFLGWAVGKSVASTRLYGDGRVRLRPYFHPNEPGAGVAIHVPF